MYRKTDIPDIYTAYLLGTIREIDTAISNKVVCLKQYTYDHARRMVVYSSWEDGKEVMRHDVYLTPDHIMQAHGVEWDSVIAGGTAVLHRHYRDMMHLLKSHIRRKEVDIT